MNADPAHAPKPEPDCARADAREPILRALSDENSHLYALFRQAPGFVAVFTGPRYVIELANDAYHELVGRRDILGKPLFEALPEVAGQGFEELLDGVRTSGQPYVGRGDAVRVRRSPGAGMTTIYVDFIYQPVFDAAGQVVSIFAQGHEVTAVHDAQAELRLANERLQAGLEGGRTAVWDWDLATGRILYSDNAASVFGCPWNEIGEVWKSVHPDDVEMVNQCVSTALAEKSSYDMVHRLVRPDSKEVVWLRSSGKVLCGPDGAPVGVRGTTIDVSAQKRAEAALAELNEELAARIARLGEVERRQRFQLEVADLLRRLRRPADVFEHVNRLLGEHLQASRVMCGDYDLENMTVTTHSNYTAAGIAPIVGTLAVERFGAANLAAFESGAVWTCADLSTDPRTCGPDTWPNFEALGIHASLVVPLSRRGTLISCLFVHQDRPRDWLEDEVRLAEDTAQRMWLAVERVRAEEALREADIRKDEFLAMLAHELRNPLAPISAAAELLRRGSLDADGIARTSQVITRQVGHMTGLVDDLLDVSRVTRGLVALDRTPVDVKRVVADAVEQIRPMVEGRRQHLSINVADDNALVLGDHKRLVQVLANMLANAAKYTREGGAIEVQMAAGGDDVTLTVTDNGIGIPEDVLPRVFELFAQAKRTPDRAQGGLGLGLALVKSLLELHGGSVAAYSKGLGHGSQFVARLPRLPADALPPAAGGQPA